MTINFLYHATDRLNIESIMRDGLRPRTYFSSNAQLTDYYAETIKDEGGDPVVLRVDIANLDEKFLSPDIHGIEEPIGFILGTTDSKIHNDWNRSKKTWRDSINLIQSLRYDASIDQGLLMIGNSDNRFLPLVISQYLAKNKEISTDEKLGECRNIYGVQIMTDIDAAENTKIKASSLESHDDLGIFFSDGKSSGDCFVQTFANLDKSLISQI